MPAAMDYQSSSVPFGSIGRSILSIRRDQFHGDEQQEQEIDSFQKHAADLFSDLASSSSSSPSAADDLLSLPWIRRLLDAFLLCQEEFRVILFNSRPLLSRPPVDRAVNDFFDRAVKALDVCNAVRDGIDQVRQWTSLLRIVALALPPGRPLGEGQLRRARKALADLAILMMIDDRDPSSSSGGGGVSILSHRNRSFGRSGNPPRESRRGGHFRSLSWSVSRSWSASKQLQAIGSNLNAPRGNEVSQTSGLAVPVYTMSSVLLFVMWALVAAIPCQDRGLQTHFSVPRSFPWAAAVTGLHERILEESKKKERRGANGLLREVHAMERCSRTLAELLDAAHVPMGEEKEAEVRAAVEELAAVCAALRDGLEPLEMQVRELFYRIVRSRTEGLDCLGKSHGGE